MRGAFVAVLGLVLAGCSGSDDGGLYGSEEVKASGGAPPGSGGAASTGGAASSGGVSVGAGGDVSTGGALPGSGGATSGAGGAAAAGGAIEAGGATSSGGASSGGADAAGGSTGAGGAPAERCALHREGTDVCLVRHSAGCEGYLEAVIPLGTCIVVKAGLGVSVAATCDGGSTAETTCTTRCENGQGAAPLIFRPLVPESLSVWLYEGDQPCTLGDLRADGSCAPCSTEFASCMVGSGGRCWNGNDAAEFYPLAL